MSQPERPRSLALVGNPNVGKTSIFNQLTGLRARVGNYPGITVERRVGAVRSRLKSGEMLDLVDAPGTYSLAARSAEEQVTLWEVLGTKETIPPDVVIAVVDAGQLARCLYLVVQLLELRVPTVIALNMMDEAGDSAPAPEKLAAALGVPVVSTDGRTGEGLDALIESAERLLESGKPFVPLVDVRYPQEARRAADRVAEFLPPELRGSVERDRALGFWALSSISDDDELEGIPNELRKAVLSDASHALDSPDHHDIDLSVASARYQMLDTLLERIGAKGELRRAHRTESVDRVLLHPFSGTLFFLAAMLVLFQALFAWADPAIGLIEAGVGALQAALLDWLPVGAFRDLLVEGVVGGVGNVIVFLPQILLLFLFVGLLEDSGYMARVAYLMDRVMRSLGLHGRAFVPMLSGFACAIPAIMATRTLERRRDRLLTMMVVPLMTCSARLPVYSLIIAALFPVDDVLGFPVQGALLLALYLLGLVMAMLSAWVLGRTAIRGKSIPLILELPPYRLPRLSTTLRMMVERAGQFLKEAGTIILVATVALWALLHFPETHLPEGNAQSSALSAEAPSHLAEQTSAERRAAALEKSYGGRLGKALEPVVRPLGFDWKIATGIIGAFAAREVFVSTMALIYGVGEVDDDALPLRQKLSQTKKKDGTTAYTPLVGLSLLVFFALACQCMSTLAVVRRETKSYRWPLLLFGYMTALAYAASFCIYQGGRLLGF